MTAQPGWLATALRRIPVVGAPLRRLDALAAERDALAAELAALRGAAMARPTIGGFEPYRLETPLTDDQRAIVDKFHDLYYRLWEQGRHTLMSSWLGYLAVKCPLDLWVYQELLVSYRPELIIECGTSYGGSALFMATICEMLGCGRILSIDIDASRVPLRPRHPRISYLTGSSTDRAIVAEAVRQAALVDRVVVMLDSDHSEAHVAGELAAYAGLVRKDGYLIVEDTDVNGHPTAPEHGPGPMEALDAFLADHPEFAVHRGFERFLMTCNPRGFLVRVA
jgi:cephalosporin hydroxylase